MPKEKKDKVKKVKKNSPSLEWKQVQAYLKKYKEKMQKMKDEKKRLKEEKKKVVEIKKKIKKKTYKKYNASSDWKEMQIYLNKIKEEKKKIKEDKKNKNLKSVNKQKTGNISEPFTAKMSGGGSSVAQKLHQPYPASVRDVVLTNGLKQTDTNTYLKKIEDDVAKNLSKIEKGIEENRFVESHVRGYIDDKYARVNDDMQILQNNEDTRNRYLLGYDERFDEIENEQKYNSNNIQLLARQANEAIKHVNNKLLEDKRDKRYKKMVKKLDLT